MTPEKQIKLLKEKLVEELALDIRRESYDSLDGKYGIDIEEAQHIARYRLTAEMPEVFK